jgi:hypothetical protein
MTHEKKINYLRIASGICRFGIDNRNLDLLVSLYDGILEKEGNFSLHDASDIEVMVDEREAVRNTSKMLDKVSKRVSEPAVEQLEKMQKEKRKK